VVAAVLLPFARFPPRPQLGGIAVLSTILGAVHFPLIFLGMRGVDAAVGAIVAPLQVPFSALLAAVLFGATQVRWLVLRARQDEAAVAAAKGALADLAHLRFSDWRLTGAEADVALFALKGCDVAEIAALRGAAAGTVRAQLARVYAKAGVRSQSALMALFMEELVETTGSEGAATERRRDP